MKPAETLDSGWKSLYRVGGAAALIVVVLILSEVIGFIFYPQPSTVIGWFTLFQSNRIIGLLDFWGLEVPMYALFTMVFLALYVVLRKANEGCMAIAMTLALLGIGIFLATNNPFSMLSLSDQYAAATTDAQRSMFLAAGQALLANTNQRAVGGFNMGLFLVSVAGVIVSLVMFRSNSFSRLTAYGNFGKCTLISRLSQRSSGAIGSCRPSRDSSECPVPRDMVRLGRPEALSTRAGWFENRGESK